jgi:N-acyl-D-amino-acid deacylase
MSEFFDLIIKNSRIIDGTGNPYYLADIGISQGEIVRIDRGLDRSGSKKVIDADGLTVSPGFFDAHSHDDAYVLLHPCCDDKILQGVTTDVIGNCGLSIGPISEDHHIEIRNMLQVLAGGQVPKDVWGIKSFNDFLKKLEEVKPGINLLPLVGHGTVRAAAMGMEKRSPTETELNEMKMLTIEAMKAGAFGLSTALILAPASFSQTEEVIELAKCVGKYKGIFAVHLRSESDWELEAIEEALRIGREAGVPIEISHHKVAGRQNWGKSVQTLKMFEKARTSGMVVTCDQYPYSAASLFLAAALPPFMQEGGPEVYAEKLKSPDVRRDVIVQIETGNNNQWENLIKNCGFEGIVIASSKNHDNYVGKSLAEIAEMKNENPYDVFFDLVVEEKASTTVILWMMDDEDVKRIMKNTLTMIGSDGLPCFGHNKCHPRMTGTFPRVLGSYVREQGLLTLEEAIRKMTSLPAQTFGVKKKGLLKEGFDADLVVFDPETILDMSTFENSVQKPEGIHWVLVNGEVAVENGQVTGVTSGQVLRHKLNY